MRKTKIKVAFLATVILLFIFSFAGDTFARGVGGVRDYEGRVEERIDMLYEKICKSLSKFERRLPGFSLPSFCEKITPPLPPPPADPVEVSCVGSPNPALIDEVVTWEVIVSGGTGAYEYSWLGTDGLSGDTASVGKDYDSQGEKTAEARVTSGDDSAMAECAVVVNPPVEPPSEDIYVVISEVYYNVDSDHGEEVTGATGVRNNEWVEIYNGGSGDIDISGWKIADAGTEDVLPEGTIVPAGGFLVITATSTTADFWDFGETVVVVLGSAIGNGLANGGDVVFLKDIENNVVDAVSWGTSILAFDPSVRAVAEGHSISRIDPDVDTDTAADWQDSAIPTPGVTNDGGIPDLE